jgi:hypothetical protein
MKDAWRILLLAHPRCTGVAFAQATTLTPTPEFTHPRNSDWLTSAGKLYGHTYGKRHVGQHAAKRRDQALDLLPAAPPS